MDYPFIKQDEQTYYYVLTGGVIRAKYNLYRQAYSFACELMDSEIHKDVVIQRVFKQNIELKRWKYIEPNLLTYKIIDYEQQK